jgi:hypothetical protein
VSLLETLRALWRRWYITVPGLILACAAAFGVWYTVPPSYERSATQLLLPGKHDMPVGSNPLLYLGGLSSSADVLARAVGADNVLKEVTKGHPGTEVVIQRDGSSSTPFLVVTVTAQSDADAREVLSNMVSRSASVLAGLQQSQHIPTSSRITLEPITVATTSTLQQRTRIIATAAAGVVVAVLALFLAALTEGLASQRHRRREESADSPIDIQPGPVAEDPDDEKADGAPVLAPRIGRSRLRSQ